ncbi:hypothetical protein TNCV_4240121 [Trichonephila clavipes]|nr:hypothetical protein TNCV_4240121 [Trichonephila clavipes]
MEWITMTIDTLWKMNRLYLKMTPARNSTPDCEQMKILARNIKYYTITIENIKANMRSLKLHGLNDEDCHIMKNTSKTRQLHRPQRTNGSEFSSLPSCDNPACAEYHTPLNTPTKK